MGAHCSPNVSGILGRYQNKLKLDVFSPALKELDVLEGNLMREIQSYAKEESKVSELVNELSEVRDLRQRMVKRFNQIELGIQRRCGSVISSAK